MAATMEMIDVKPLNEIVFDRVKALITDNALKPGEQINIDQVASELGVSRMPVVMAVQQLALDGFVEIRPRKGSYVRTYSPEEIASVFEMREAMELLVLKRVIQNMTPQQESDLQNFHRCLKKLDENFTGSKRQLDAFFAVEVDYHEFLINQFPPLLSEKINRILDLSKRIRKQHLHYMRKVKGERYFSDYEIHLHIKMIEAIIERDLEKASRYLAEDIGMTKDEIIRDLDLIETA